MNDYRTLINNADLALHNKQYDEALKWYVEALKVNPDDVYCLSRCGAISAEHQRYEDAVDFMRRAYEIDPENGDNIFNYGNACLIRQDYMKAFQLFVEAERKGCSPDVLPTLYLQMSLICSMRHDSEAAAVYLDKCAEADSTGLLMLDPEIISKKLNIYAEMGDYKNAAKTAAELVAAAPTMYPYYMLQFSIMVSQKEFADAEKILDVAERYAKMTEKDKMNLLLQRASLYMVWADEDPEKNPGKLEQAAEILSAYREKTAVGYDRNQVSATLAEVCNRLDRYDDAISILLDCVGRDLMNSILLTQTATELPQDEAVSVDMELSDADYAEIDLQLAKDMQALEEKIAEGTIDPNLEPTSFGINEDGLEVPYFDDSAFANLVSSDETQTSVDTAKEEEPAQESEVETVDLTEEEKDLREHALYLLLTALLEKDDFASARRCGEILMNCRNQNYAYYGRYAEAVSSFKLDGMTEETKMKYARAIAFFRNRTFANAKDTLAAVLRARLYAERGDYEKAEELSGLLAEQDRKTLLAYIEKGRADSGKE